MAIFHRLTTRAAVVAVAAALATSLSSAQSLVDVSSLQLSTPGSVGARPQTSTPGNRDVQIVVRLADKPLAAQLGANAARTGISWSRDQQRAYVSALQEKQDALMAQIGALGGRELARVTKGHNALVVQVSPRRVHEVARLPGVSKIRPVVDYEQSLSTSVPYIGATAVQGSGYDGTGIVVAVLDSGIDYTHRNLFGPGTVPAYVAAYGASTADAKNKTRDGLFPTAKVIEGFDFVGEVWPNGPLAPDPDPIDCGPAAIPAPCAGGHGTHVADIIAGQSVDGLHKGVAPGAKLLAVKVCSAVATSCSGVALLQAVDFSLDPNGDNDLSDAVDVVNLSLGSPYGQREDDLSEALAIAVRFGVVVVASAGNSADRPYVAGSPSTTPEVISVAQTQMPNATAVPLVINAPPSIAGTYTNTATLDFAPVGAGATGNVAFVGRGCPAGSIAPGSPEDPYLDNPAGKIALIDRGACAVSLKIDRAANAGAIAVLIGLVAPGDAVSFSYGGGTNFVPSLVITQAVSNLIKANIGAPVNATISQANAIPLVGSMASSSSRGPNHSYAMIKPDIGAPGASISAEVGTGTGESAFGGTSGAAPMVSGSAALLLQKHPTYSPMEIKAKLMNSAETNILTNPATQPGVLAPITRIGGGEVRVDKAANLTTAAWNFIDQASVGLSFGYKAATGVQTLAQRVEVRNYAGVARTYNITPSFRYANDAASGGVVLGAPPSITVPANSSAIFTMTARINAANLPTWVLNGGSGGGNGVALNLPEYDGYVTIADATDTVRLPWHVLPHKAANTKAFHTNVELSGQPSSTLNLMNAGGAVGGRVDVFSLTGTSGRFPTSVLPGPGDNFAVIDLRAVGVRLVDVGGGTLGVQFAVNTYGHRSHPAYPAEFDVYVDSNNDGVDDFVLFNAENGGFGASGQTVIGVFNLTTKATVVRFFADADLNSANMIQTALLSDLGLTPATKFRFSVYAFDNYFTGALTDAITDMTYTLGTPRYVGTGVSTVAPNTVAPLTVSSVPGGAAASPSQTGLLLMYRDAKPGIEAEAVLVTP